MRAKARVVVLAASACETRAHPAQLEVARSSRTGSRTRSGLVGKYLMDTVGAALGGQIPALENLPPHNEDGAGGDHVYAPWWLYKEQLAGKLGFARGYHIEIRRRPRACRASASIAGLERLHRRQLRHASSRKTRAATTARSSASPAAAR